MTVQLSGDKALDNAEKDRLGFAATSEAIASAILRQPEIDGLVVGIEGRWGSGKSSLVNMTTAALRKADTFPSPEIIEFKPWLIGDRDSLLLALFSELAIAADAIEESAGDATSRKRRELGTAGDKIRKFAAQLGGLGTLAKATGTFVPLVGIAGEAIGAAASAAKEWDGKRSIADEKVELRERLASLPRRIVVTIDDVDRLEPSEVVEIFRLVRSVADFPNVVYVLCYDPGIVSHSIQVAARVENGLAYIEKIVQIAISVPVPESFDLRRWFGEEIDALPHSPDEAGSWRTRLSSTIDVEGGRYLITPRHVARCLDGIRFFWSALHEHVDLADLVWLNLIKVGNPKLYEWIQRYLPETAAQSSGMAIISDADRKAAQQALDTALQVEGVENEHVRYRLSEYLPGFDSGFSFGEERAAIYARVSSEEIAIASRSKRLASPDHYRLYFAIQQPRNSPSRADFDALFTALDESVEKTTELLGKWNQQLLTSGASKAEAMLNRIASADEQVLQPKRAQVLLCALSDKMDDLASPHSNVYGEPLSWPQAQRVVKSQISKLGPARETTLQYMFRGYALEWLTKVLRDETFAHGRAGEQASGDSILTADELDRVSAIMIGRYRSLTLAEWGALHRPLSALYAWSQAGDADGPKAMITPHLVSDEGLVRVLELLGGKVIDSTRGEYVALVEQTLTHFLDYNEARRRIESLSNEAVDGDIKRRARLLLEKFESIDR